MVNQREGEHGVALILVLLGLAMLAAVGVALTLSSTLARVAAANYDDAVNLMNAAESALDLASRELASVDLDEVLSGARTSTLVDGPAGARSVAPGVTLDLPVMTNHLTCGRADPCSDAQVRQATVQRPWGAANPRWRLFIHQFLDGPPLPHPSTSVYIVVWIGDDAREDDGDPTTDGAGPAHEGRYIVRARAEAFGARGSRRAIEAELSRLCVDGPAGAECAPGTRLRSWRSVSSSVP
jgi:hypothetical protein